MYFENKSCHEVSLCGTPIVHVALVVIIGTTILVLYFWAKLLQLIERSGPDFCLLLRVSSD